MHASARRVTPLHASALGALATGLALLLAACGAGEAEPELAIHTDFEGAGLGGWEKTDPGTLDLELHTDTESSHARWYSFRVEGAEGRPLTFRFTNADDVNASGAWSYNRPVVSSDGGSTWERIPETDYEDGVFTFQHTPGSEEEWIAYVPVYNFSRWTDLVERVENDPRVADVRVIGESLEGRPIHLLRITDPATADETQPALWAVARQHPAETGGSWKAEGLLEWLLSEDPQAQAMLEGGEVYLAGFLNPDGVTLGNYRVNRAGVNLNRVWDDPDPETEPEVHAVHREMHRFVEDGGEISFFVDLHSHSTIRRNFFYWNDAEATSPAMAQEMEAFMARFEEINPDFTKEGSSGGSTGNEGVAANWAYNDLGVHAVTFESAYQDVTYGPYEGEYLTVERLLALGRDFGRTAAEVLYDESREEETAAGSR